MRFILSLALLGNSVNLALAQSCNQDNCLRNLFDPRFVAAASTFCQTFTQAAHTAASAIPAYIANCNGSPSRVSSACSCVVPATSAASVTTSQTPAVSKTAATASASMSTSTSSLTAAASTSTATVSASSAHGGSTSASSSSTAAAGIPTTSKTSSATPTSFSTITTSPTSRSTSSTSPPTSTPPAAAPSGSCSQCSHQGDASQGGRYLLGILSATSLAACAQTCARLQHCSSFGFDENTSAGCGTYAGTVSQVTAQPGIASKADKFAFYDLSCYQQSCA